MLLALTNIVHKHCGDCHGNILTGHIKVMFSHIKVFLVLFPHVCNISRLMHLFCAQGVLFPVLLCTFCYQMDCDTLETNLISVVI